jgi:hypothetical protein
MTKRGYDVAASPIRIGLLGVVAVGAHTGLSHAKQE